MSYLIWRLWGSLLVAMLFGVFFGWLIWGSLVRRLRRELAQARRTSYEIVPYTGHETAGGYEIGTVFEAPRTMAAAVGYSGDATPQESLRPVLDSLFEPLDPAVIAQRAFEFSQQRGFQHGTQQEDWLRAERQLHLERLQAARERLEST